MLVKICASVGDLVDVVVSGGSGHILSLIYACSRNKAHFQRRPPETSDREVLTHMVWGQDRFWTTAYGPSRGELLNRNSRKNFKVKLIEK